MHPVTPVRLAIAGLAVMLAGPPATAEIRVGVVLAATGALAAVGGPQRSAWPQTIGSERVTVIIMDDGGDPGHATRGGRDLIRRENVDILVGSSGGATTLALAAVAEEFGVPHLPLFAQTAASGSSNLPSVMFEHMRAGKVATVGYIGLSNSWGELWLAQLNGLGVTMGVRPVWVERYTPDDTDVTSAASRIAASNPDAVMIGAYGTTAMLPHLALRARGYANPIYHTHDTTTNDFIGLAGPAAKGTFLPASPDILFRIRLKRMANSMLGAEQRIGAVNTLVRLVPAALRAGNPGSTTFRAALRAAIEKDKDVGGTGSGESDDRSWVLVTVADGDWTVAH